MLLTNRNECKLIENIFGIRKIFVGWRAKHEATYIVNTKTHDTNVDRVMAMQSVSIVESHDLLDCTAKCSTRVRSILVFLAKYYKQTILAPPYLHLRPLSRAMAPLPPPPCHHATASDLRSSLVLNHMSKFGLICYKYINTASDFLSIMYGSKQAC